MSSAASLHGDACGVARPESSVCGHCNAVGLTSIPDRDSFSTDDKSG